MTLAPHPWNRGFTWPDHAGPFRRVTPEQARAYDEQGFFVLEDAVDAETVAALDRGHRAVRPRGHGLPRHPARRPLQHRRRRHRVDRAPPRGAQRRCCRDFCTSELMADLCHDLVGPDARLYWDQSVYKRPHGAEPVLWHQDNGYTYIEPQAYLTVWVALTDATPENGCVQVLPGRAPRRHRRPPRTRRSATSAAATPRARSRCRSAPGDAVVFSSLTPHATGRNTTDDIRARVHRAVRARRRRVPARRSRRRSARACDPQACPSASSRSSSPAIAPDRARRAGAARSEQASLPIGGSKCSAAATTIAASHLERRPRYPPGRSAQPRATRATG